MRTYVIIGYFLGMERDPLVQIVAANIETIMRQKSISASALARSASLNPTGVYDIIKGKSRSPRLDTLSKLADALGVSVIELMSRPGADETRSQILRAFERLPEIEQQRLLQTALAWLPDQERA